MPYFTYEFNVVENYNSIEVSEIGFGMLSYEAGGFILPFEVISVLIGCGHDRRNRNCKRKKIRTIKLT